jgi:FMN phosphatase YigB (HAD superfamily)
VLQAVTFDFWNTLMWEEPGSLREKRLEFWADGLPEVHADRLELFDGMSFSDEVGHYKPARAIFEHALTSVGSVAPERAAHVGDRRRTDVSGALAMGMTAVRYNGVYEDEAIRAPEADVVVGNLAELPAALGVAELSR